jgi:hypothetical protein
MVEVNEMRRMTAFTATGLTVLVFGLVSPKAEAEVYYGTTTAVAVAATAQPPGCAPAVPSTCIPGVG